MVNTVKNKCYLCEPHSSDISVQHFKLPLLSSNTIPPQLKPSWLTRSVLANMILLLFPCWSYKADTLVFLLCCYSLSSFLWLTYIRITKFNFISEYLINNFLFNSVVISLYVPLSTSTSVSIYIYLYHLYIYRRAFKSTCTK